jgi:hypothetical protein
LPGIGSRVNNIVGIALTHDEDGYWMVGSDGKVYGFGSAKVAPAPTGLQSNLPVAAFAGIPVPPPTVGFAQRIFQGVQHYAPNDRFERTSVNVYPDAPSGSPESSVGFRCLTCGAGQPFPYAFTVDWYGSRDAAVGDVVSYIKIAQSITPGQAYAPQYVAGNAVMGPSAPTPWPPPERIVTAFG